MHNNDRSPRYSNPSYSHERTSDFAETQKEYQELLETSNAIFRKEYDPTRQERSDLARWALKIAKKDELYPLQTIDALVHAGAVFPDKGFRRYAQGVIEDSLQHTGDNIKWTHDATADTWHKIDLGVEANSIGAVDLQSHIDIEERHGIYQEEILRKTMASMALSNQKRHEEAQKVAAIADSDSLELATGALYDPFADDEVATNEDFAPMRTKRR